jgi:RNA methyltransferase, TrmH family
MKKLTSSQNPRIKAAIRLKSTRGRKTQQRIIVFGHRESMRAIQSGVVPLEVFLSSDLLTKLELDELTAAIPASVEVYDLPEDVIARLRYGERTDGVVIIAQRPAMKLEGLKLNVSASPSPLIVILESIEKPGNIGAVLRSVDGAGASAVVIADSQCDALHPNCIRASMSSVFTIPIAIASTDETIAWCKKYGLAICCMSDAGSTSYLDVDWSGPVAMVFGNEANGLSSAWHDASDRLVSIPMQGISDSLNISVAAGVALYEARRQRQAIAT